MKQFWLFAFEDHDAAGGMRDFVNSFDTLEAAMCAPTNYCEWAHVLDSHSQRVVAYRDEDHAWRTGSWEITKFAN